jgi:hypothetical protein
MRRLIALFVIAATLAGCAQKPAFEELADGPIGAQYSMLVENQGYQFDDCAIASEVIKQDVSVTSGEQVFSLTYRLSFNRETLGVESAGLSDANPQQNV